jgi:hypothetical protein
MSPAFPRSRGHWLPMPMSPSARCGRHGSRLRDTNLAGKFAFRQGLWIEDLRIPPGQECSNGSLILLAVVLWRTFYKVTRTPAYLTGWTHLHCETPKNKNDTLFADSGEMRQTECSHSLAKTSRRPAFSNAAKEQSGDDNPKERERDRLWNHWLQREEGSEVSHFRQVVETLCGQAGHRNRLDACSRVAASAWRPGEGALAKKMHMQMRNAFTRIWPAIDNDTIAAR